MKMKKKTIRRRQISRDCWSLDHAFMKWLQEHLPVYLSEGGKVVDLTFHKFEYKGVKYTQEELIKKLIKLVDAAVEYNLWDNGYIETCDEVLDIWKVLYHAMWW